MTVTTCIFDAYGTLFDVTAAARIAAAEPGREALADIWQTLAENWRRKQLEYSWTRALMGQSIPRLLASHLLVPTCWLRTEARDVSFDLLALKERFPTASHEILAWRLLDLPDPCIITIIDNDAIHQRRSNAWRVRKELSPVERQCQRYISKHSRAHEVREQGWTVQGWPVHQVDWKREILRSVIDEWDAG